MNRLQKITDKLGLAQMVRLLLVELTHLGSNTKFDVGVTDLRLIILSVVGDVPVDSKAHFDQLYESQD
jgi:hypothetical protein